MEEKSRKPSPLTVVGQAAQNGPPPPRRLGPAGETLWNSIQAEFRIEDCGGQELLMQCCLAADRTEELAATIDEDGARIVGKNGIKEHPLLKHELAARAFICRTLARLGITSEPLKPIGRPPRGY